MTEPQPPPQPQPQPQLSNDCEECGFAAEGVTPADVVAGLRKMGRRYQAPLTRFLPGEDGAAVVRQRPAERVWSALEYACHVRDVLGWYDDRVRLALAEDRPTAVGPTPDEAAEQSRYNEQDPVEVAAALAANAERLAATFESMPDDGWGRVYFRRGYEWTVLFTAVRSLHEGNHHLLDIGRGMRAVREASKAGDR